jgi:PKD repeat protein
MFPRIVSQLSLSPSAASNLAFYARRLAQERVTRAFSAVAAVMIVVLQLAIIAAPPTPVNAASQSDIIFGGITGKDDLLNHYDDNASLRRLFSYFAITRDNLEHTTRGWVNSHDQNDTLKSIGRLQYRRSDVEVDVGDKTYWGSPLDIWDTGANVQRGSNYEVLAGYSSAREYFAVMIHCGNIIFKHYPELPKPTPPPKPTPKPSPAPTPKAATLACVDLDADYTQGDAPLTVKFTGLGAATGQTIDDYVFELGDNNLEHKATGSVVHTYENPGTFIAHLRVHGSKGKSTENTPQCSATITVNTPPTAYTKHKTAFNVTQAVDATTKDAHGGDVIRYTLTTANVGHADEKYAVVEHIDDILEYADVTDAGGGEVDTHNGVITWAAAPLGKGKSLVKTFTVTVKNPIPTTNVGISNPGSYDLKMDNVYGDAVRVNLQPPLAKQVEAASTSLPDTGTPTATIVVLIVSGLTLYFFLRNRQLITEIKLLRGDLQGGTG